MMLAIDISYSRVDQACISFPSLIGTLPTTQSSNEPDFQGLHRFKPGGNISQPSAISIDMVRSQPKPAMENGRQSVNGGGIFNISHPPLQLTISWKTLSRYYKTYSKERTLGSNTIPPEASGFQRPNLSKALFPSPSTSNTGRKETC